MTRNLQLVTPSQQTTPDPDGLLHLAPNLIVLMAGIHAKSGSTTPCIDRVESYIKQVI